MHTHAPKLQRAEFLSTQQAQILTRPAAGLDIMMRETVAHLSLNLVVWHFLPALLILLIHFAESDLIARRECSCNQEHAEDKKFFTSTNNLRHSRDFRKPLLDDLDGARINLSKFFLAISVSSSCSVSSRSCGF